MVGGIPLDFNTPSKYFPGDYFIIEGDEYDSAFFEKFPKFLQYAPQILIVNNIEFDHADIYNTLQEITQQFRFLLRLVPQNGVVIANGDDEIVRDVCQHSWSPVIYYGTEKRNTVTFVIEQAEGTFFVEISDERNNRIRIPMEFPLEGMGYNMTAAYIAAREAGISREDILKGFQEFKGVKRRLEKIFDQDGLIVYDDFAHHPTAVRITLDAIKQKYPDRPVLAVFEPRSNTSIRNIFVEEYKQALLAADQVFLAPAFKKADVKNEDLLPVGEICNYLNSAGKKASTAEGHEQLFDLCKDSLPVNGVLVLMSNGSFEPFKSKLLEYLNSG